MIENWTNPVDVLRARLLERPIECPSCEHWIPYGTPWCRMYEEDQRQRGESCCHDWKEYPNFRFDGHPFVEKP